MFGFIEVDGEKEESFKIKCIDQRTIHQLPDKTLKFKLISEEAHKMVVLKK